MYGREDGQEGAHGVRKAQDLGPMLTFRQHLRPGWEAGGEREHQPLSRILAAELAAVQPDLSEVKGTCGNPLPAKGESSGSRWLLEGPLRNVNDRKTRSRQGLDSLASLFTGALPLGTTRSAPGLGSSTSLVPVASPAGWWCLLQSGLGAQLGGSPQAFGPAQVGDCTQNGGHPAAREPPLLLNKTLLPPGLGSHQKVGASRSGSRGLLCPQPLRHCPHSGNQTKRLQLVEGNL